MAATDALAATKDDEPTANGREFKNRLIRVYSCAFAVGGVLAKKQDFHL